MNNAGAILAKIREFLRFPSKPSRALVAWMRDPGVLHGASALTLSDVRQTKPPNISSEDWEEAQFFKKLGDSIQGQGAPFAAVINANVVGEPEIVGSVVPSDRYLQSLVIISPIVLTLSDLSVKTLHVQQHNVSIRAKNCTIRELIVNADGVNADIRLDGCSVGTLRVVHGAIGHYEMQGGRLLNVVCPPPGGPNPFTGTVSLTPDVFFPRERNTYILTGPQPYRNLRYHLRALENAQMANLIHSAELAVEREDDSWTNRFVSYLYEWMSDFGSSALRPLLWLLLLYVSSVYAIVCSDSAEVPEPSGLVGWQHALTDPAWGEYTRAFYLPLQSLVNPVGIFGPRYLLVPKYTPLAAWLSVQGFIGLILVALLIFAIRRRFKIQA